MNCASFAKRRTAINWCSHALTNAFAPIVCPGVRTSVQSVVSRSASASNWTENTREWPLVLVLNVDSKFFKESCVYESEIYWDCLISCQTLVWSETLKILESDLSVHLLSRSRELGSLTDHRDRLTIVHFKLTTPNPTKRWSSPNEAILVNHHRVTSGHRHVFFFNIYFYPTTIDTTTKVSCSWQTWIVRKDAEEARYGQLCLTTDFQISPLTNHYNIFYSHSII